MVTDAEPSGETEQDKSVSEPRESDDGIIIVEENSVEPEKPRLIEKETYSFDDAKYTLNGVVIHIDSITLDRVFKSSGYGNFKGMC